MYIDESDFPGRVVTSLPHGHRGLLQWTPPLFISNGNGPRNSVIPDGMSSVWGCFCRNEQEQLHSHSTRNSVHLHVCLRFLAPFAAKYTCRLCKHWPTGTMKDQKLCLKQEQSCCFVWKLIFVLGPRASKSVNMWIKGVSLTLRLHFEEHGAPWHSLYALMGNIPIHLPDPCGKQGDSLRWCFCEHLPLWSSSGWCAPDHCKTGNLGDLICCGPIDTLDPFTVSITCVSWLFLTHGVLVWNIYVSNPLR